MDSSNPVVSVILPSYNRAHLISRAIQSVLDQTYRDFELIIVDDGSTDNTEEVVRTVCDERIRYIKHEINKGANAARNTGILAARGEYIGFQDSDDEWLTHKLEEQMRIFSSAPEHVGVVYTGFWRIEGEKRTYIPSTSIVCKQGNIHKELLYKNFVTTQVVLVKKTCFNKAGFFDESLPRFQDWELFIRISKYFHFLYIDKPFVHSYFTLDSISADHRARIIAYQYIVEKHLDDIKIDRLLYSYHLFTLGKLQCEAGEFPLGRRNIIKALIINPRCIRCLGGVIVSLLGEKVYLGVIKFYQGILMYNT